MNEPTLVVSNEPAGRRREEGSAYLLVLMLLVVLTIVGLSLSVVTQTEVFIGGSEKQTTRQYYSASSGIHLASAYELVTHDPAMHDFRIQQRQQRLLGQDVTIGDRVCSSPFYPVHTTVCNLCMLNQDNQYFAIQNAVTATSLRHGDDELAARKTIGSVVALEPWTRSPVAPQMTSHERVTDPGVIDVDPSTEVDACEGLFLQI